MITPDNNPNSPAAFGINQLVVMASQIRLQPSRYWLFGVLCLHIMMVIAVLLSSLPILVHVLLFSAFAFTTARFMRDWYLQPVYRLFLHGEVWCLQPEGKPSMILRIQRCLFWSTRLLIIEVSIDGVTRTMPLVVDQCVEAHYRWLRVVLKNLSADSGSLQSHSVRQN